MEWINLRHGRKGWLALGNAVMNLCVPRNVAKFLTGRGPVTFQEGLCVIELVICFSQENLSE